MGKENGLQHINEDLKKKLLQNKINDPEKIIEVIANGPFPINEKVDTLGGYASTNELSVLWLDKVAAVRALATLKNPLSLKWLKNLKSNLDEEVRKVAKVEYENLQMKLKGMRKDLYKKPENQQS